MRNHAISPRPLLSSKLSKHVSNYTHSWSASFFVLEHRHRFSFKHDSNYLHFRSASFFMCLTDFQFLHISLGNTTFLVRRSIPSFGTYFIIVVFLLENITFWCVDGFVIFHYISILLHVLGNIQHFDAHLRKS